jgi:membrane protease YdiL (CAAX protease family)
MAVRIQAVFGLAVLIGPVVEEVLFRGVVFGSIRQKNRILAYVVSMVLFSVYHIWQYCGGLRGPHALHYAIQYLPVCFALAGPTSAAAPCGPRWPCTCS